jgi:hypothetical protein
MSTIRAKWAAAAMAVVTLVAGCRVEDSKHGDSDNVKIATPFGGMSVKTNQDVVVAGVGLPTYPGAVMVKKGDDKDSGAADVNFSFGSFQLRVKAVSFKTSDSPEKVSAFYRKALGKYGDVLECENDKPVGKLLQTSQGLTCDNDKENHISVTDDLSGKMELKAGSKKHQHIVGIDPDGTGTKFGLVALDLPGHIEIDGDDSGDSSQ